ncbi:BTB POZ domain protein [Rutstroemia sp. NJR-2017a WRK4]|nr:BTB POZ domain protein [Rutstroemia sp. NJR-2017a WRK4]
MRLIGVNYLNSPSLSDGIIECENKEFKIHKLVLCAQSNYFSKAFQGDWKESTDGHITLKEDDVSAVEAMLRFMYTFDYDASSSAKSSSSPMVFNAKVYSIADKYEVLSLKSYAKQKFETTVETCWDMDDFPHAIAEVYNSTPSVDQGLRKVVVDAACKHLDQLLSKQGFRDMLEGTEGFAPDVVQTLAKCQKQSETPSQIKYRCPNCQKQWEAVLPSAGESYYCIYCGNRRANWTSYIV